MVFILFFIVLLNVVAIALTYYCLENMDKKEKVIFIAVGIAIIYMLTSFAYWISTKDIEIKEVSETGKNLITFLFVPINTIAILPLLAKSYKKYKIGKLKSDKFRNRIIVFVAILAILLVIECSYFKDIQNSVVKMMEDNQKKKNENSVVVDTNDVDMNLINSMAEEGDITFLNEEGSNAVSNSEYVNEMNSNQVSANITD